MAIVDEYAVCGITFRLPVAYVPADRGKAIEEAIGAWLRAKYPDLERIHAELAPVQAAFKLVDDPFNVWLQDYIKANKPNFDNPPHDNYADGMSVSEEYRRILLAEGREAAANFLAYVEKEWPLYHERAAFEQSQARTKWYRDLHTSPEYLNLVEDVDRQGDLLEVVWAKYHRALNIAALMHEEEIHIFLVTGKFPS